MSRSARRIWVWLGPKFTRPDVSRYIAPRIPPCGTAFGGRTSSDDGAASGTARACDVGTFMKIDRNGTSGEAPDGEISCGFGLGVP